MSRLDPADLPEPTLSAWLDWRRYHREKGHSPRHEQACGETIAQAQRFLDERHPGEQLLTATRERLSDYLLWAGGPPRRPSTGAARHRVLRAWYRWLVSEEIIASSPMERVQAPDPHYAVPAVLADDALRALIAACAVPRGARASVRMLRLRDEALIRVLCEPGSPRASELAGMADADADLDSDTLFIRRGKGGDPRAVPMSPATARALSRYRRARDLAGHGGTGSLWTGLKGPLTRFGVGQAVAAIARRAGTGHVHPHQLRHTAYSDFDEASGGNTGAAMALFGWKSDAMTRHYGRAAAAGRAVRAARAMNRGARL